MRKLADHPQFAALRTKQVAKQAGARTLRDLRAAPKDFEKMTNAEKDAALKAILQRFGVAK